MTLEQAREQFIKEHFAPFVNDPSIRSVSASGACRYRGDNKKCLVGRVIPDEKYSPDLENRLVCDDKVFGVLPKEIRRLGKDFLVSMQDLHDHDRHWNKKSMSSGGIVEFDDVMRSYYVPLTFKGLMETL